MSKTLKYIKVFLQLYDHESVPFSRFIKVSADLKLKSLICSYSAGYYIFLQLCTKFNSAVDAKLLVLKRGLATCTAWKKSKYRVFSASYFRAFGLYTENYGVNLRIQSEDWKIRTRQNPVFGHFLRNEYPSIWANTTNLHLKKLKMELWSIWKKQLGNTYI